MRSMVNMKRSGVRLSVLSFHRQQRRVAGLLLSAVRTGDIDRAPGSNSAAARRSAANAGSVTLTAEGRG